MSPKQTPIYFRPLCRVPKSLGVVLGRIRSLEAQRKQLEKTFLQIEWRLNGLMGGVVGIAAGAFGVTPAQILSRDRTERVARARMVSMYLCHRHLGVNASSIGLFHGGRDRTTVRLALQTMRDHLDVYPAFRTKIQSLSEAAEVFANAHHRIPG